MQPVQMPPINGRMDLPNGACTFRDSLIITAVNPMPVVNLGADITRCEGQTVVLDATQPGATYLWQDGSTNSTFNVTQQGNYSVELNLNGCKKSDSIFVRYNLKPVFSLGDDQFICPGITIQIRPQLEPGWQLSWQNGTSTPVFTVTQPGTYQLTATNQCGATTDELKVLPGLCQVYVPNAFTPNGDGLNDFFKASGTEKINVYNLKVFNRYGQILFETNDKHRGWDDKFKGQASPGGAFIYMIQYKTIDSDEFINLKGTLLLVR